MMIRFPPACVSTSSALIVVGHPSVAQFHGEICPAPAYFSSSVSSACLSSSHSRWVLLRMKSGSILCSVRLIECPLVAICASCGSAHLPWLNDPATGIHPCFVGVIVVSWPTSFSLPATCVPSCSETVRSRRRPSHHPAKCCTKKDPRSTPSKHARSAPILLACFSFTRPPHKIKASPALITHTHTLHPLRPTDCTPSSRPDFVGLFFLSPAPPHKIKGRAPGLPTPAVTSALLTAQLLQPYFVNLSAAFCVAKLYAAFPRFQSPPPPPSYADFMRSHATPALPPPGASGRAHGDGSSRPAVFLRRFARAAVLILILMAAVSGVFFLDGLVIRIQSQ